jgi:SNF2 family DNA or RNA helicase
MNKITKEFPSKYLLLDDYIKEVLQVMTLIHAPESNATVISCLIGCGIRQVPKKALTYKDFRAALRILKKLDFILTTNDGYLYINKFISSDIILNHCANNPKLEKYLTVIDKKIPYKQLTYNFYDTSEIKRLERDFYNAFLLNDAVRLEQAKTNIIIDELPSYYSQTMWFAFTPELANKIPLKIRWLSIRALCLTRIYNKLPLTDILPYLEINGTGKNRLDCVMLHAHCLLIMGKLESILQLQHKNTDLFKPYDMATLHFMQGDLDKAQKLFELMIKHNSIGKKIYCPTGLTGMFYLLTQIACNETDTPLFEKRINSAIRNDKNSQVYYIFKAFLAHKKGNKIATDKMIKKCLNYSHSLHEHIVIATILCIIDEQKNWFHMLQLELEDLLKQGLTNGYHFLAYQAYKILAKSGTITTAKLEKNCKISAANKKLLKELEKQYIDLSKLIKQEEDWVKALKLLKNISAIKGKTVAKNQTTRLIWLFSHDQYGISFAPREQKLNKNGTWSKGRAVSLKRIKNNEVECMSAIDSKIGQSIIEESYGWGSYGSSEFVLDTDKAMQYFTKHPYIFLADSPTTPVELIEEKVQLIVKKTTKGYKISFSTPFERPGMNIIQETPSRFRIMQIEDIHLEILHSFGPKQKLIIPATAKVELKNILNGLSSLMTVHSDIAGIGSATTEKITSSKGDPTPHLHLLPVGDAIRAELFVRPFKNSGPYFKPGNGAAHILAEIKGVNCEASRNLTQEKKAAQAIISATPALNMRGTIQDSFEFESPEAGLELLLELQQVKDKLIIEWPEGEKLRISRKYAINDMKFAVTKHTDWFELNATLQIDEKRVMNIYEILEKAGKSKFVELSKGEFIALTEQLKQQLEALTNFASRSKNKMKIHALNTHQIDDILEDCNSFKPGKLWQDQIKKIRNAEEYSPKVPSTLQAELRPYQVDGFKWLSRLAHWGVGACLADDMGLGKTIQALAVILERAPHGPTLVIAPASVCMNWLAEVAKFTPSLNPIFFGASDRNKILNKLKPFDLIISSYGLMRSEEKKFTKIKWQTIVLDEAQYIKNIKAQRTKAAFALQGEFKIITSGTPVENHLTELWTLFSFINPGILGNQTEFAAKFAIPIEQNGDKQAKQALKKLIQPFLLRRNKTEVLDELPPKTEINLAVQFSPAESAFYEALRRKSVANIDEIKNGQKGAVQLKILAELTKLRQACCHPALIEPNCNIESAKLKMFAEIVTEMIENRHKALVFSQFVGHLKILRAYCDEHQIKYQYLDGSTPLKKRQQAVDAFQAGEGDLFLISLKAGGTGLNLTAADYVIHMDPWWNPAVEDQASDRTHRIGQQRPVTIYRMVAIGTVEDKIIALHKQKRELADSLLDGTDAAAKMSLNELINLLQ